MARENSFQHELIIDIEHLLPGCIVMKADANYVQGFPDLLILFENKWAALECKRNMNSHRQPNQDYYVDKLNSMSFASYICPENKELVLDELQQAFKLGRTACIPWGQSISLG